jgi:hypothetical protein
VVATDVHKRSKKTGTLNPGPTSVSLSRNPGFSRSSPGTGATYGTRRRCFSMSLRFTEPARPRKYSCAVRIAPTFSASVARHAGRAESVESVRGLHSVCVLVRAHKKDTEPKPVTKINNTAWKAARERAGVSFEDRQDLLGHRSGRITTHYSRAELASLIEAADKVCETESRKSPATTWLRRKTG